MIFAKIKDGVVTDIIDVEKTLDPPRYIEITGLSPQPQVGWRYADGVFTEALPETEVRKLLDDVIDLLEKAGLVSRL